MSDDIVDLLLVTIPIEASQQEYLTFEQVVMRDAADEIKRLRAEVARLGSFLHPVGMVVNTYGTSLTKRARNET